MQNKIKILNKEFELFLSSDQIQNRIKELAVNLNNDMKHSSVVFLSILNGSIYFTADLTRQLDFSCEISCVKVNSYSAMSSSANINKLIGIERSLKGKHIVIIEDIIDTGLTLNEIMNWLKEFEPSKIDVVTLLLKPIALKFDIKPDYIGFEVPDHFYLGYGMDYNKQGRNFRDIYKYLK